MSLFKNFWGTIDPHSEMIALTEHIPILKVDLEDTFKSVAIKEDIVKPKFTVRDIHQDFYNEVNALLEQANIRKSVDVDQSEIDKFEALSALGFHNAKPAKKIADSIKEKELLDEANQKKRELIDAINYFSFKYPNYKFITEDGIKRICEKYGLLYSSADKYIGDIPEKNIEHLLRFKIEEEDVVYSSIIQTLYMGGGGDTFNIIGSQSYVAKRSVIENQYGAVSRLFKPCSKAPLMIAANKKDFDMTRVEVKDYQLQDIPDPVVFQPVVYKEKPYYLIITAWGDEASDELVVNHKMN